MNLEESLNLQNMVRQSQQERRAKVASTLSLGFTFRSDGRSGFIYYRAGNRLLEIYVELSGLPQYDLLVSTSGLDTWIYPEVMPLTPDECGGVRAEFSTWLDQQKFKTDYQ